MKNEKSYLGRKPEHARIAIMAVLEKADVIGEDIAYEICGEILSDICADSICVNSRSAIWDTLQELSEEGWF